MISLWYCNTKNIDQQDLKVLLKYLPREAINENNGYKNERYRKLNLVCKLIVEKYHKDHNLEFRWSEWNSSAEIKTLCNGIWKFNISHSGDYVVVAFSESDIGIGIEEIEICNVIPISHYLHPNETAYIESSADSNSRFFKLWTRKKAYLKATGKNSIGELHKENCLQNELTDKRKWYLHSLSIIQNHKVALCTPIPDCQICTRELFPIEFKSITSNRNKILKTVIKHLLNLIHT